MVEIGLKTLHHFCFNSYWNAMMRKLRDLNFWNPELIGSPCIWISFGLTWWWQQRCRKRVIFVQGRDTCPCRSRLRQNRLRHDQRDCVQGRELRHDPRTNVVTLCNEQKLTIIIEKSEFRHHQCNLMIDWS